MAVNINLLPTELKVSTGLSRVLSILRMIGVIALAAFIIFGVGLGAFFVVSTIELNNLNATNNGLKSQLTSLSQTETQFFLIKDRIQKIKTAQSIPSVTNDLVNFQPFISSFENSRVTELDINPGKITTTLTFSSNKDLSNFITAVSSSNLYSNVTVTAFAFNPTGGYSVNLTLTAKK